VLAGLGAPLVIGHAEPADGSPAGGPGTLLSWTPAEALLPADAYARGGDLTRGGLVDVSCPTTAWCGAVGYFDDTTATRQGLLAAWNGSRWSTKQAPQPAGGTGTVNLSSISCPAAGWCAAVGQYDDASATQQGILLVLADGSWSATEAPLITPADPADVELLSVACAGPGSCVAVGRYQSSDPADGAPPLVETLAGGAWTPSVPGLPATTGTDPQSLLTSVACPTSTWCEAVGQLQSVVGSTETYSGLAERLSPGVSSAAVLTLARAVGPPAPAPDPVIPDPQVACGAVGTCVAVADYPVAGGARVGVVAALEAGGWKVRAAPLPATAAGTADTTLVAVACGTATGCTAVGGYGTAAGPAPLIETWARRAWTAQPGPVPAGASGPAGLDGVSCRSAKVCVAVGQDTVGPFADGPLVEQLSTTWQAEAPGLPTSAAPGSAGLTAVSCAGPSVCAGVGQYQDTGGDGQGLFETS